jgi:D-sedoheptulose 7-phosphate isomerase
MSVAELFLPYFDVWCRGVECSRNPRHVVAEMAKARDDNRVVFFIGNGASATIASHMAIDWQKTANVAAMCFNDSASLTAYGNDMGFENVFVEPLRMYANVDDVMFAISSSGRSANVVKAAQWAKEFGLTVVTLTGFDPANPLRQIGDFNFYVPSDRYGVVEATHLAICHAILDEVCTE